MVGGGVWQCRVRGLRHRGGGGGRRGMRSGECRVAVAVCAFLVGWEMGDSGRVGSGFVWEGRWEKGVEEEEGVGRGREGRVDGRCRWVGCGG